MKCDIKIMASPQRYASVYNLCKILDLDIEKDVFFDDRPNGGDAAYTSRKTWELPFDGDDITHRCVLQDDVILCRNFKHTLERIIDIKPFDFWTLFCPNQTLAKFQQGTIVEVKRGGVYGPAIVVPRVFVDDIYKWGETQSGGRPIIHDDVLIGEYALYHKIGIYTTSPTIVQHGAAERSLLGYGRAGKVSKCFDIDADKVNWEFQKSITIPNTMSFYKR